MLGRVDRAPQSDSVRALQDFTDGARGFRTADTYVFCIGPDGIMSAHPSPILRGHDVRDPHDRTGNEFIRTMKEVAKLGQIAVIRALFPKRRSSVEEPKAPSSTKAGDQACAVGVYNADVAAPADATADGRAAQRRRRPTARSRAAPARIGPPSWRR